MPSQPIISASVPDEIMLELDQIARNRNTTRSVVIKQLLEYALNQYAKSQREFHEVQV
jgi:metal-responsive CopG/Arc/MetJ family transcriptional regulator